MTRRPSYTLLILLGFTSTVHAEALDRDHEIALALEAAPADGTPTSPLFVVDEKTPHALMIVPVPTGPAAGHSHAAPK